MLEVLETARGRCGNLSKDLGLDELQLYPFGDLDSFLELCIPCTIYLKIDCLGVGEQAGHPARLGVAVPSVWSPKRDQNVTKATAAA